MRSRFEVVIDVGSLPLVIRDVGHSEGCKTVTNDAELVVLDLRARGLLPPGRRLLYYDSDGQCDEIIIDHLGFVRFAPGPGMRID